MWKKKKNGEKVEKIIVRNLLKTILFINEHGSIRSKWRNFITKIALF